MVVNSRDRAMTILLAALAPRNVSIVAVPQTSCGGPTRLMSLNRKSRERFHPTRPRLVMKICCQASEIHPAA